MHHLRGCKENTACFWNSPSQVYNQHPLWRKHQTNPKWEAWPVLFKSVKFIKVKQRLKNCSILKNTREIWQVNTRRFWIKCFFFSLLVFFSLEDINGCLAKLLFWQLNLKWLAGESFVFLCLFLCVCMCVFWLLWLFYIFKIISNFQ